VQAAIGQSQFLGTATPKTKTDKRINQTTRAYLENIIMVLCVTARPCAWDSAEPFLLLLCLNMIKNEGDALTRPTPKFSRSTNRPKSSDTYAPLNNRNGLT
jgi:hypothetical protein